jgi:hypothetical protein
MLEAFITAVWVGGWGLMMSVAIARDYFTGYYFKKYYEFFF